MTFIETFGKEITALLVPFIAWLLNTFTRAKAKLFLSIPHRFTFLVQEPIRDAEGNITIPVQTVNTISIWLRNVGRETATNVEIVFNWKPLCLNVWPSRHFTEHTEADNRYIIIFDSLAPNESVGCEILTINSEMPALIIARSDQCVAQRMDMFPQPTIKPWRRQVNMLFMLAGLGVIAYLAILLLQFLVLKTPLGY